MRFPRFTTLQLLLAAALVALVLGLFTASWRVSTYHQINQIVFSPSGQFLAAKYGGGAIQVWRLGGSRPRLVAQAFGGPSLLGFDASSMQFVSDDRLLKFEPRFVAGSVRTTVRELTISTRAVQTIEPVHGLATYLRVPVVAGDRLYYADFPNAAQVCGYNLQTQTCDRRWQVPSPVAELTISADGRALAVTDQTGLIHLIDTQMDDAPLELAAAGMQSAALSGDGRLLARPWSAPAAGSGTAVIGLCGTRDPGLSGNIVTELWNVDWVALSADGSRLAAVGEAAECYDVKSKRRIARFALDDVPSTYWAGMWPMPPQVFMRRAAFSPDGSLLATYGGGQIQLHELPSGRIVHTLTGGLRTLQIAIFTVGFALWAAAWGIAAKRERLRRPPEKLPEPVGRTAGRPIPAVRSPWRVLGQASLWMLLVLLLLAAFVSLNRPFSLSIVLGTLGYLAGGLLAVLALVVGYLAVVRVVMGPHHFTLLRLRQVTASTGRFVPWGNVQFWFAAPSPHEAHVGPVFDEVQRRMRELFGDGGPRGGPPTLVAWLDRQCDLDAFVGRHAPVAAIVPNVWSARTAIVCEETALASFGRPLTALRAALTLMFSIRLKRGLLPGWVAGLLSREICRDEESPADIRAAARRLQVLLARRPDWDPRSVLLRPAAERRELWFALDQAAAWREVHAEVDLLATLHPLLLGQDAPAGRRERVLGWLRSIRPKDDPVATLTQALGISLDDLLAEWRAALEGPGAIAYDAPLAGRQAQFQSLIARLVLDRSRPAAARAMATRSLGGASFVGAAGPLIGLLADPRCDFRAEAIETLENLSGRRLGDDPAAWQAWWSSLPAELRWQADQPPLLAELAGEPALPRALRSASQAARAPLELRLVWGLMVVGGLVALAIPITFLFLVGPLVFFTIYLSLLVGLRAIACGAARESRGLAGVARLQALNIVACDPINLLFSAIEHALLRSPRVQQHLALCGGER